MRKGRRYRKHSLWVLGSALGILATASILASPANDKSDKPDKEERRRLKAAQKEMESPYKKWLQEEVPYIITSEERAAFKKLPTYEHPNQFIEPFWHPRNPSPPHPK